MSVSGPLGILSRIYRKIESVRPGTATGIKLSPAASEQLARLSFTDDGPAVPVGTPLDNMKVLDAFDEGDYEVYHVVFGPKGKAPNDVVVDLGINAVENVKGVTISKLGYDQIGVFVDGAMVATLAPVLATGVPVAGQVAIIL